MKQVKFPAKKRIIHKITRPLAWCYATDKGKRLQKYHDKDVLTTTLVQLCSRKRLGFFACLSFNKTITKRLKDPS